MPHPLHRHAGRNNIISLLEQFILIILWLKLIRRNSQLQSNFPEYSVFVVWLSLELNGNGPHLEEPGGVPLDTLAFWFLSKGLINILQGFANVEINLWRPNKYRAESDPLIQAPRYIDKKREAQRSKVVGQSHAADRDQDCNPGHWLKVIQELQKMYNNVWCDA